MKNVACLAGVIQGEGGEGGGGVEKKAPFFSQFFLATTSTLSTIYACEKCVDAGKATPDIHSLVGGSTLVITYKFSVSSQVD